MADEQPPPKRDIDELFTLDASDPTSDADGPLAHLLSASPLADLGRPLDTPTVADPSTPSEDGLPGLSDVGGLEDLYVNTAELPPGARPSEPLPPTFAPGRTEPEDLRPVDQRTVEPVAIDLTPAGPRPAGPRPTGPKPRTDEPVLGRPHPAGGDDPVRLFEVGGNLRFSTEAGARSAGAWSATGPDRPYPAALVPGAIPTPVAPNKSVRVPGEERRRGGLLTALIEITERRWFWASTAGFVGLVIVGLLAAGNIVPNPLITDRSGVVADSRLPAAPAVDEGPETSEADTASSTGAGTGGLEPGDATSSSTTETSASLTSATAGRRVTTAPATVRSTTTVPSSQTTASSSSSSSSVSTSTSASSTTTTASTTATTASTTTTAASSSTTATTASSTTGSSNSTTSTSVSTTATTALSGSTDDSGVP